MNDDQLMNQIRKYVVSLREIKDVRNIRPNSIHNLFMPICKNVILLNLDESKMEYVLELEEIFRNLKRAWIDLRNIWGSEEGKMQTEIKENLKDNIAQFAEIRKRSIKLESLQESKKSNRKSTVIVVITLISLAVAITIPLILFFA